MDRVLGLLSRIFWIPRVRAAAATAWRIIVVLFLIVFALHIVLGLSVFVYSLFYYFYVPVAQHTFPVYFDFLASRPFTYFPLGSGARPLLHPHQGYNIYLRMSMPESDENRAAGMIMVDFVLGDSVDKVIGLIDAPSTPRTTQVSFCAWL